MPLDEAKTVLRNLLLQWDRAFDSAECKATNPITTLALILQWDRAFDSAECWRPTTAAAYGLTFNGTAHLIARNETGLQRLSP